MQNKVFKLSIANLPTGNNPYELALNAIYTNHPELSGFSLAASFWDNPTNPVALILVFQKPNG